MSTYRFINIYKISSHEFLLYHYSSLDTANVYDIVSLNYFSLGCSEYINKQLADFKVKCDKAVEFHQRSVTESINKFEKAGIWEGDL